MCMEKLANPGRFYETPQEVLIDNQLSREQKQSILLSWQQQLDWKIKSTDENMQCI